MGNDLVQSKKCTIVHITNVLLVDISLSINDKLR